MVVVVLLLVLLLLTSHTLPPCLQAYIGNDFVPLTKGPIMEVVTAPIDPCFGVDAGVDTRVVDHVGNFISALHSQIGPGQAGNTVAMPLSEALAGLEGDDAPELQYENWLTDAYRAQDNGGIWVGGFIGSQFPNTPERSLYPQFTYGMPLEQLPAMLNDYATPYHQGGRACNDDMAEHAHFALELSRRVFPDLEDDLAPDLQAACPGLHAADREVKTAVKAVVVAMSNYLAPAFEQALAAGALLKNVVSQASAARPQPQPAAPFHPARLTCAPPRLRTAGVQDEPGDRPHYRRKGNDDAERRRNMHRCDCSCPHRRLVRHRWRLRWRPLPDQPRRQRRGHPKGGLGYAAGRGNRLRETDPERHPGSLHWWPYPAGPGAHHWGHAQHIQRANQR